MNACATSSAAIRRHSLLKRNPRLSRAHFSEYYEFHHGPLAAAQAGFRKFTSHYLQNHVTDLPDGSQPAFDGITMTTQVPRPDYRQGFFAEPDYQNVRTDEEYLFDLSRTVSLLGAEMIETAGARSPFKALVLARQQDFDRTMFPGIVRLVLNCLDLSTASALGFGACSFEHDLLAEVWFASERHRQDAYHVATASIPFGVGYVVLPVREVLIFGPDKPWTSSRPPLNRVEKQAG